MFCGKLPIRIPTTDGSCIALNIDVVDFDIPFLLGIDKLDR